MPAISVKGLHVRRYKNLREVYVPWSDGVAIFGINGAGKTNLLECLALLAGTERTVDLARARLVDPGSADLAIDVQVDESQLPLPPDEAFPLEGMLPDSIESVPGLVRAAGDANWWHGLQALGGGSFAAGLGTSMLPPELAELLAQLAERPIIRWTLGSVNLARREEGSTSRRFERTLLTDAMPDWLRQMASALPDEFAPLRSALASGDDGTTGGWPLVTLPGIWDPPVTVEWLSRGRSSAEAQDDLVEQFDYSSTPARVIASRLEALEVVDTADPDPFWLCHLVAVDAANEDLAITLPYLCARPVGEGSADLAFDDTRSQEAEVERTRTTDETFLEPFSAGERRWVDEAVATAARALRSHGDRWEWQARLLASMDRDILVEDLLSVVDAVDAEVRSSGWLTAEAMQMMLGAIESKVVAEMRERLAEQDVLQRAWQETVNPDVLSLRARLTIRIFDEPEAHLHPSAQRQIADALERLRLRGSHVVITSHSPHFLGLANWHLVHAQPTAEGTTLSTLSAADLDARKALAGQMGLTRGELLTHIGYLLVVEGEGDRVVLEAFYGQRLRDAGVGIVRMHGTNNLLATVDLDFIQRYLDVAVGVLLDYTRMEVVNSNKPTKELGDEEQQLRHLRRACKEQGRRIDEYSIDRPDITACLDAETIRESVPSFPGWAPVLRRFQNLNHRPSFKPWLLREYGVDLEHVGKVKALVNRMLEQGARPSPDLEKQVEQIARAAAAGSWPSPFTDRQEIE